MRIMQQVDEFDTPHEGKHKGIKRSVRNLDLLGEPQFVTFHRTARIVLKDFDAPPKVTWEYVGMINDIAAVD